MSNLVLFLTALTLTASIVTGAIVFMHKFFSRLDLLLSLPGKLDKLTAEVTAVKDELQSHGAQLTTLNGRVRA